MDIQSEKVALIERLKQVNDMSLLQAIKHMLDYGLSKSEERISVEQYNKEIEEAEAAIDRGEYYTQEEVEKMAKKW